jgi:hypothetical protein
MGSALKTKRIAIGPRDGKTPEKRLREMLKKVTAKDGYVDPRTAMKAFVLEETSYTAYKDKRTGRFRAIKNPEMRMLESMARDKDPEERMRAATGLGNFGVICPELSDWTDSILMVLGTDKDVWVRITANVALNMKKSMAQHYLESEEI